MPALEIPAQQIAASVTQLARPGDRVEQILAVARETAADLVVMRTARTPWVPRRPARQHDRTRAAAPGVSAARGAGVSGQFVRIGRRDVGPSKERHDCHGLGGLPAAGVVSMTRRRRSGCQQSCRGRTNLAGWSRPGVDLVVGRVDDRSEKLPAFSCAPP